MRTIANVAEVLGDLMAINNESIRTYQSAIKKRMWNDSKLHMLFEFFVIRALNFNTELAYAIHQYGQEQSKSGFNTIGKLQRAWLSVKASISGKDHQSILNACEREEKASKQAYQEALHEAIDFPTEVHDLLRKQTNELAKGFDRIRTLQLNIEQ